MYYNSRLALTYETEEYRISGDHWEYTIEKKSTGEVAGFPMTGTEGKTVTCCGNLFGRGDKVYYFQETGIHPNAGSDSIHTTMDLVELDLCDMKQRVLYHWDAPYEKWFFGLLEKPETEDSYYGMEMLFVHEDSLYYRESTDIFRMSLLTGSVTEVLTCNRIDLSYDGSNLYYLDDYNRLTICNLASEKTISRNDINANQFFLTEEGIYFTNRADENRLYLWNQSTDTVSVADSVPPWIQDNVY